MNKLGEKSEIDVYPTEASEQINVTRQAYSALGIEPNEKNKTIAKLLMKNPLKKLFDERKDSSLGQLRNYHREMKEILRDQYRKPFPTCAELDKDGNVIALFRQTANVVSGGDSEPFVDDSFIIGPQGVFRIGGLERFEQGSSRGRIGVSRADSSGVILKIESVEHAKSLIEEFETDPFAEENGGKLVEAYEMIVEKMRE
jgi:hypothetical protein